MFLYTLIKGKVQLSSPLFLFFIKPKNAKKRANKWVKRYSVPVFYIDQINLALYDKEYQNK